MKRFLLIPLVAAGCAAAPPPQPVSAPIAPLALEGPTWRLAQIDGAAVVDETLMVFRAGKITGQGPCNTLLGSYDRQGEAFSIDAIVTTKKSCARLAEENRMLDGMLLAQTAQLRRGGLEIGSDRGPVLRFELAGN